MILNGGEMKYIRLIPRKVVKYFDSHFLRSFLTNLRNIRFTVRGILGSATTPHANSFHMNFKSIENDFAILCHRYGTDKGVASKSLGEHILQRNVHNYSDFYNFLFCKRRNSIQRVFECGIGTNNASLVSSMGKMGIPGASLRVWREYFPNAQIVGADIDIDCLFSENRIETYFVDQTEPNSIQSMWEQIGVAKFDLIVDDGLHTYEGGRILFENSIEFLSDDGLYIIEDVNPWDVRKFEVYFQDSAYFVYYVHLLRRGISLADNSLIVIQKP